MRLLLTEMHGRFSREWKKPYRCEFEEGLKCWVPIQDLAPQGETEEVGTDLGHLLQDR